MMLDSVIYLKTNYAEVCVVSKFLVQLFIMFENVLKIDVIYIR